jgi:mRNA interferase MazF
VVTFQGDIWWADFGVPIGSAPGYHRPVVIVQGDDLNRSRVATTICVPLTGTMKWASAPGNLVLRAAETGLDHDCVANVSLLTVIDRRQLTEHVGRVNAAMIKRLFAGIDVVLGRRTAN